MAFGDHESSWAKKKGPLWAVPFSSLLLFYLVQEIGMPNFFFHFSF